MLSLISKIKNIDSKNFFILLILLLFLTDIVIILDVPGFREILPAIYFTIVPGLLIIILMNLNKLEFVKKFVLWIGLSLSFIILLGLGLNSLYPLLSQPLSLIPLLVSFNLLTISLALIAYLRNKEEFEIERVFNFHMDRKDKYVSPMLFALVFPFLTFFGTYLMNTTNNNSILLLMLFLIPIYFIVLIGLRDKISNSTYPFAILMISLSFFLMHGLTSNYLIGRDNHWEFFCFNYTMLNLHWDASIFSNTLNNCLSINLLPTIYSVLTSIPGVYVYKVVFGFIGAIIPLIIYLISKKLLGNKYAIFAAFLVMFQMNFMELLSLIRQEFALIFLFLAILTLFDTDLGKINRKILFLVFMISVILSHYSTAFVALGMTIPILLIPFFKNLLLERRVKLINFDVMAVLGLFSYLWYFVVAKAQSNTATKVIAKSSGSVAGETAKTAVNKTFENTIPSVYGMGIDSIPKLISVIVNDAVFLIIGIGLLATVLGCVAVFLEHKTFQNYKDNALLVFIKRFKKYKKNMPFEFVLGAILSTGLLALFIIIPYFSNAYGASRIFLTCLVFLAPMFVIGGIAIARMLKKPKIDIVILVILIVSLFTVSIHFNYYLSGIPSSHYFDENSNARIETYIYDQDILGAKFLSSYGDQGLIKVHGDEVTGFRLMAANNFTIENRTFIHWNNSMVFTKVPTYRYHQYLYLSYHNTKKDIIFELTAPVFITNSTSKNTLIKEWESRIYDNGGSRVLIP